ncbi:MAG: YceI family protein [Flavobacteriaceae bacterium]
MKTLIASTLFCSLAFFSCKKENSNTTPTIPQQETTKQTNYSIDSEATEIHWTAYKTTDKKAVEGVFTKLNITESTPSITKQDVFKNLTFEIPVSSFFSNNDVRDNKIKTLFFGVMENTTLITGTFSKIDGNNVNGHLTMNLNMNNNTVNVPLTYSINNNIITLNGTINNLLDWKMKQAFDSLHKSCELLHTGEDGISKTWQDVAIGATVVLKH